MKTIVLFIILVILIFIMFKNICKKQKCPEKICNYENYKNQITNLNKIINADKNIFNYIRCINVPQTPTCTTKDNGDNVCRSRFIDCNKFKLVIQNDPIAVERMKIITDLFYESDKPKPPSEISVPINSWFN